MVAGGAGYDQCALSMAEQEVQRYSAFIPVSGALSAVEIFSEFVAERPRLRKRTDIFQLIVASGLVFRIHENTVLEDNNSMFTFD